MTEIRKQSTQGGFPLALLALALTALIVTGCGSRQVQDSLVGSTAQRLVSYAIDDLARALPDEDFAPLSGQRLRIVSHGLADRALSDYADQRIAAELGQRFGIRMVSGLEEADQVLQIFYTSLGTDQGHLGFFIPLALCPGLTKAHASI